MSLQMALHTLHVDVFTGLELDMVSYQQQPTRYYTMYGECWVSLGTLYDLMASPTAIYLYTKG